MPNVRVWNDNVHPYSENFQGQKIHIDSKSFIVMDQEKAEQFRCTYNGVKRDKHDQPDPRYFKMIRIEYGEVKATEIKRDENQCLACKYKASGKADLDEHVKANHEAQITKDDEAEAEIKKRGPRKKSAEAQAG
jgi:hypothetical protein